jgi:hypothetical protein
VYHGNKEHSFWVQGLKSKILGFFHFKYEISVRQSTIMLYVRNLGLLPDAGCRMPDDDQYGPMLHWPPKASKLRFLSSFSINKKFLDRVPSCPKFEIWSLGRMMANMGQ